MNTPPALGDIGGRSVEAYVTDDLRVQLTAPKDTTDTAEVDIIAATVRYQFDENSRVEGGVAQSDGRGLGANLSTDGGLTFVLDPAGAVTDSGQAYRFETYLDLEDLGGSRPGDFGAYVEHRDDGFATLSSTTSVGKTIWGFCGSYAASDQLELRAAADFLRRDDGYRDGEVRVELGHVLNPRTKLEAGLRSGMNGEMSRTTWRN